MNETERQFISETFRSFNKRLQELEGDKKKLEAKILRLEQDAKRKEAMLKEMAGKNRLVESRIINIKDRLSVIQHAAMTTPRNK